MKSAAKNPSVGRISLKILAKYSILADGDDMFFTNNTFFRLLSKTSLALMFSFKLYSLYYDEASSYSTSSAMTFLV